MACLNVLSFLFPSLSPCILVHLHSQWCIITPSLLIFQLMFLPHPFLLANEERPFQFVDLCTENRRISQSLFLSHVCRLVYICIWGYAQQCINALQNILGTEKNALTCACMSEQVCIQAGHSPTCLPSFPPHHSSSLLQTDPLNSTQKH